MALVALLKKIDGRGLFLLWLMVSYGLSSIIPSHGPCAPLISCAFVRCPTGDLKPNGRLSSNHKYGPNINRRGVSGVSEYTGRRQTDRNGK